MMLLILVFTLPLVYSKPHSPPHQQRDIVQIEKQELRQITPDDQDAKKILNKIEEFNRSQGLLNKRDKQLPTVQRIDFAKQQQFQLPQFGEFMQNPFVNPILNYLHHGEQQQNSQYKNSEIQPEDHVPGQYIKRKITHQQSMIIPGPTMIHLVNNEMPVYTPSLGFAKEAPPHASQEDAHQTVENIRNIMHNQVPFSYMGPYGYPYGYQPAQMLYPQLQRQGSWQSPLTQYFPIVIKDPIQQIINAFTSMVEYGPPPSNNQAQCADIFKCTDRNGNPKECKREEGKNLNIENLALAYNKKELKVDERDEPRVMEKETKAAQTMRINNKLPSIIDALGIKSTNKSEDLKAGGLFSAQQAGKIKEYSQDNTGTGVFLHKLRVREGGVAIAGPGGIATAGNGGTAIVGPDGYAYTQPDSLAIAGSGTKVVAVNPGIDLGQLVKNISKGNGEISSRVGRIVAVGPVVYYNKG